MTAVFENGVEVGRYDYDRNLIRVRRVTQTENVEYVLDDKHVLNELDGSQAGKPSIRRYHYGTKVLAVVESAGTSYILNDGIGSASDFWNSGGLLAKSRQYDAWGGFRNGTAPAAGEAKVAYTGHQYDPETGWVYAKARYYDSGLGVFLSRDAFPYSPTEAPSLYRYARGNPLRYWDPSGYVDNATVKADWAQAQCEAGNGCGGPPVLIIDYDIGQSIRDSNYTIAQKKDAASESFSSAVYALGMGEGGAAWQYTKQGVGYLGEWAGEAISHPVVQATAFLASLLFVPEKEAITAVESAGEVGAVRLVETTQATGKGRVFTGAAIESPPANGGVKVALDSRGLADGRGVSGVASRPIQPGENPLPSHTLLDINPGYPNVGRVNNCANCAVAYDATAAGRPASALPAMEGKTMSSMESTVGGTFEKTDFVSIEIDLANSGPGARGIVTAKNVNGEAGHAFNVQNTEGKVRFVDAQSGTVYDDPTTRFRNWYIMRTDGK